MSTNTITIVGSLTDDPRLDHRDDGKAICRPTVVVRNQIRDGETNEWSDHLQGHFTVRIWDDQATNVVASLRQGDRVIIVGRMQQRSWIDMNGETQFSFEVEAEEVAPSLRGTQATLSRHTNTA